MSVDTLIGQYSPSSFQSPENTVYQRGLSDPQREPGNAHRGTVKILFTPDKTPISPLFGVQTPQLGVAECAKAKRPREDIICPLAIMSPLSSSTLGAIPLPTDAGYECPELTAEDLESWVNAERNHFDRNKTMKVETEMSNAVDSGNAPQDEVNSSHSSPTGTASYTASLPKE